MRKKTEPHIKTRQAILTRLKQMGPQTAPSLAKYLQRTPMAIRLHLYDLAQEDMVSYTEKNQARGRPAKFWALAAQAEKIFPDAHQNLAVDLLNSIRLSLGQSGLEKVIDTHSNKQLADYQNRLSALTTLPDRINALAEIRNEEGYMAKAATDGRDWMILENHCPICSAAKACTRLCDNELWVFEQVLGPDVTVTREEHILSGARRCRYRISEK